MSAVNYSFQRVDPRRCTGGLRHPSHIAMGLESGSGLPGPVKRIFAELEPSMAMMKRELSDTPDGRWCLVYDTAENRLYVEAALGQGTERIGIDSALTLAGTDADELRLAIVDLFNG